MAAYVTRTEGVYVSYHYVAKLWRAARIYDEPADQRCSAILPPWCRKTPKITEVLPLLYLHGLSSGDFVPARASSWAARRGCRAGDHEADRDLEGRATRLRRRDLSGRGLRLRLGRWHPRQHPPRGAQTLPAGDDRGARRWPQGARRAGRRLPGVGRVVGGSAARLRPARHVRAGARGRGRRARVLGRAARGLPATREQRCWFHKSANVLGALPKSAHPGAKKALAEIWNAEDRRHALDAVKPSRPATGRSSPRRSRRSPTISASCWRSTTSAP